MKRFIIALLTAVITAAAAAQNPENEEIVKAPEERSDTSSRQIIGPQNDDLVLRTDNWSGTLSMEIGGYEIALGSTDKPSKVKRSSYSIGLCMLDIGFIALTSPDYAGYTPEQKGFLDLRGSKSVHVRMNVLNYNLTLNRLDAPTIWKLYTGLSFTYDNLTFADKITLGRENGRVFPLAIDDRYERSKYKVERIGIPVGIALYNRNTRLGVQLSINSSLLLDERLKYKKPKVKSDFSGAASFQSSIRMAVRYYSIGIYAEYSFTPLFKSGCGPKCNIYSIGFSLGGIAFSNRKR